jgi:hypothetical protein
MGEAPAAIAVKAILRPIIKAIYYLITWIRTHKLVSLITLVLLALSISLTTRYITGYWPFSAPNSDTLQQSIKNNSQLSPDVQNWLVALRNGDIDAMLNIQKTIPSTVVHPDAGVFISEFSEKYAGVTWKSVKVISISTAPDGTVDTFVEIDMTQPAPQGQTPTNIIVLWHFTTIPQLQGRIFRIDYVSARPSLQ